MMKSVSISAVALTLSIIALPAQACDMHGGGFLIPGQEWKPYTFNPKVYNEDPSSDYQTESRYTPVPKADAKPSFSNAANRASAAAKARLAKRKADQEQKPEPKKTDETKSSL